MRERTHAGGMQKPLPRLIQGGMGIGVSNWRLARAVSSQGQLGVVSGTALHLVLARRLQQGDSGGRMLHALRHFPHIAAAARIVETWYIPRGKKTEEAFRSLPPLELPLARAEMELLAAAAFCEVFLAKENHLHPVGLNLLEKVQIPTLPLLYGAMLAGVDYVFMGAGIPNHIPGVLDLLARGEKAVLKIDAEGSAPEWQPVAEFSPERFFHGEPPLLKRPRFVPIVSSAVLAKTLVKKANGSIDGFVVEGSSAGGHNAPPRGPLQQNERGEPVYGARDQPDFGVFRDLGLPFWLAGSQGHPGALQKALALGAAGIQVGTPFAFCEESGLDPALKQRVISLAIQGACDVFTDPLASPTGFPFKVVRLAGTLSDQDIAARRKRRCDVGLLRRPYFRQDRSLGYRCPAEPEAAFVGKGGEGQAARGRLCLCNGLLAGVGLAQTFGGQAEPPLLTAGDSLNSIAQFLEPGASGYPAARVLKLLVQPPSPLHETIS